MNVIMTNSLLVSVSCVPEIGTFFLNLYFLYSMDRTTTEEGLLSCSSHTILSTGDEDNCLYTTISILSVISITTHGTSFWCQ